jgi:predicted peroxiredoxin
MQRREVEMARRQFLGLLAGLPLAAGLGIGAARAEKRLNIMMKSAWGSDDPTKAAFPFLHGHALLKAGHDVRIFLLGEAVGLMRKSEAEAVVPVGWPPLIETLKELVAAKVPIYACGACSAPAASPKPTSPTSAPSSAIRRSSSRWWNGRTG